MIHFYKDRLFTYLIFILIKPYIFDTIQQAGNDQTVLNILISAWTCEVKSRSTSDFRPVIFHTIPSVIKIYKSTFLECHVGNLKSYYLHSEIINEIWHVKLTMNMTQKYSYHSFSTVNDRNTHFKRQYIFVLYIRILINKLESYIAFIPET